MSEDRHSLEKNAKQEGLEKASLFSKIKSAFRRGFGTKRRLENGRKGGDGMSHLIIAASDTHGQSEYLKLLRDVYPRADAFIFCGDLEDDPGRIKGWAMVKGNNDWYSTAPDARVIQIGDVKVFVTHSHLFGYYNREQKLAARAKENGCRLALYGHTHRGSIEEIDGVMLVNPGSMSQPRDGKDPSYAEIWIEDDGSIRPRLIYLPQWPFAPSKRWYWG